MSAIPWGGRHALALAAVLLAQPAAGLQTLRDTLKVCATCHGEDGTSRRQSVPSLAGQPEIFLTNQLIFFREGLRESQDMTPQAEKLTDPDIEAIAAHYAGLAPRSNDAPADEPLLARGSALARTLRCGTCHLPDFSGRQQMPRLAGQREDYLSKAMRAYRDETRGGPDTTMNDILRGVGDADIAALAHFLSRQGGRP